MSVWSSPIHRRMSRNACSISAGERVESGVIELARDLASRSTSFI